MSTNCTKKYNNATTAQNVSESNINSRPLFL